MSAAGNKNPNDNNDANNIIFTTKETKLYVPVVLYQQETIKNYQKFLAKDLKDLFFKWIKAKCENKNMTNKFRYFLGLFFVLVNRFFRLVYANKDSTYKTFKPNRYYLPKGIMKTYNAIINGKNFYDQATDSDIKQYKQIRVLTTEQSEDYTIEFLLDYD